MGEAKDEGRQESEFRVEDRRRIDPETGAARGAGDVPLPGGGVLKEAPGRDPETELPVTFAALVQPFYLMGLTGLGLVPHPESQQPQLDLSLARHAIATLELLKSRTAASCPPEEVRLLDEVVSGLKLQFVEVTRRGRS